VRKDGVTQDANTTDYGEILDAIGVPIVVVRRDFTIACFNLAAANVLDVTQSDIGRSPRFVSMLSGLPHLERWCAQVISTEIPTQHDIHGADQSFIVRIAPCTKSDGQISGTVLTFSNVTAFRASIDQAIYEREYTKAILNAVADPLVVLGADLDVQTANRAFHSMFQVTRDVIQGVPLHQLSRALDALGLVTQLKKTTSGDGSLQYFEIDCDVPEIGLRTFLINAVRFAAPRPSALAMALVGFHDITAHKKAEEHMRMLMAELDHRVKNVLARISMVAMSTRQRSRSTDEFIRILNGRIRAMAAAHSVLSQSSWYGAGVTDLVRQQLAPYTTDANTTISGSDVMLTAAQSQALAIVLHELVTNAAKYGALSSPNGRVSVRWDRHSNVDAAASLTMEWREFGGPAIVAPIQSGYGTSLILELIPHELGGKVDLVFAAEGACCRIEIPLEER
jgi:two-component sensor histidine kinase